MSKTNQGAFYNKKFHNVFECKKKITKNLNVLKKRERLQCLKTGFSDLLENYYKILIRMRKKWCDIF